MGDVNEPLDVRPARPEDLPEVLDVFHAVDLDTAGETLMDAVDLEGFWADPTLDPERDTRLVRDGGRPVAAAVAFANGFARVDVVPDACGRGLGTQLAQWVEGRQRERGADHCEQEVFGTDVRTRAFLEGRGYVPAHESWSLELPADATIAERPLPDGVVVRPMRPGEELVVHQVVEDAFNEWEGRTPRAFESWKALVLDRPGMTADHLLVAACGDEVLGACVGMDGESADEYWVAQLAVRRDQRGRGIAQQLLAVSYAAARSRGRTRGRLDTDSRTGALSLYERLGMHVTLSFQNLRLDL
jgi:GNAT superfamily N-acetyltransferase